MGLISMLYVVFASMALFACVHGLVISYKWKGEIIYLSAAWLSLTVFVSFIFLSLCLSPWGISCPPFTMLRIEVLLGQIVVASMIWLVYFLLKISKKSYILPGTVLFFILVVLTLVLPERVLFGENASYNKVTILFDENLIRLDQHFTVWRALIDLTVLLLVVHLVLFLINQKEFHRRRMNFAIFSGLILALIAVSFDQLVDLGEIHFSLLLPTAIFIFYIILEISVFYQLIQKLHEQSLDIQEESMWKQLLSNSNFIVVRLNRMGTVEGINQFFCTLTGFSKEEVIGQDWFEFFIPRSSFYNVQGAFLDALNSDFQPQYINPILDKNKNELIIKWFNIKTTDKEGVVNGSLSIGVNITDDVKQKEVLEQKLKEADALIASLESRLSSSRNPG